MDSALEFHSLRRSYITHRIEDGHDPLFVQQQVGHDHASTTAIYTCVSSDFRTRSLRRVLDATVEAALRSLLDCARCGRRTSKSAEWSDGPICRTCYERRDARPRQLPCCGTDRLLPGRDTDGTPICRAYASIARDFFCERCALRGVPARRTSLRTLHTLRHAQPSPRQRHWPRRPSAATAGHHPAGDGPTQEPPDLTPKPQRRPSPPRLGRRNRRAHPRWAAPGTTLRTVAHLRDLLMDSGVLPRVDRQLMLYERWLTERLGVIEDPEHCRLLQISPPGTRCGACGARPTRRLWDVPRSARRNRRSLR
ncbi:tyrosine-type recombinase/integrase [Streptomyces goshikiensis]|uniref:site-specific integrase n=1 Tax=Streptomyces goshikiensis TaxID=1942 RepID=UPI00332654EA